MNEHPKTVEGTMSGESIYKKAQVMATVLFSFGLISACSDNPTQLNQQVSNTKYVAKETFSYDVDLANRSQFILEGINGRITVMGKPHYDSFEISGEKRVASESRQDAEHYLTKLKVNVSELSNEVIVKTSQPNESRGRNYTVDYEISLPNDVHISIAHVNGEVVLRGVQAGTTVALVNGTIESELTLPLDGKIDQAIVNGKIDLSIPKATSAEFTADVFNGAIKVTGFDFREVATTARSLRGTAGSGRGSIDLHATNGIINIFGH